MRCGKSWIGSIEADNAHPFSFVDGPSRIPDRRASSAHGVRAHSQNLSYADLCTQRGRRKVKILVFPQVRAPAARIG